MHWYVRMIVEQCLLKTFYPLLQDELNLPVRIFGGHLGKYWLHDLYVGAFLNAQLLIFTVADKLRLKIPWSNLYGAPVVAEVDGLFVVAGPASGKQLHQLLEGW